MNGLSGFMGGFYHLCEWIMRFAVINLLWLFFNLPTIFIVINMFFAEQRSDLFVLMAPLILLAPLFFFPATAAMFASVRDWVVKEEDRPLLRSFLKYYKANYKKSLLAGFILTAVWVIWTVDFYYFSEENSMIMTIFLIVGMMLLVYTINFFSVNAHYNEKLRTLLKNTLLITFGSFTLFLTVFLGSALIMYVSFNNLQFLLPFFTGSFTAFISFSAFYRLYFKITKGSDEEK